MTRALSTPPVIASGSLGDCPQPVLPAAGSLLLRPWEEADAPAFLSAYQDDEIRRWHTRRPASEAEALEWFHAYRQDWKREKGATGRSPATARKYSAGSRCAAWTSTTA